MASNAKMRKTIWYRTGYDHGFWTGGTEPSEKDVPAKRERAWLEHCPRECYLEGFKDGVADRKKHDAEEAEKETDRWFLRDLAERLMRVPVMHGTDQGDVDRLTDIANRMET